MFFWLSNLIRPGRIFSCNYLCSCEHFFPVCHKISDGAASEVAIRLERGPFDSRDVDAYGFALSWYEEWRAKRDLDPGRESAGQLEDGR